MIRAGVMAAGFLGALLPACAALAQAEPAQTRRLNPSGRDVALGGPLREGDFILGEIDYVLTAQDVILVDSRQLLTLIGPRLAPSSRSALTAELQGRDQIDASHLAALGLALRYDPATFGLILDIPADARPREVLSLSGASAGASVEPVSPAGFSAYVTAYAVADYVHAGNGSDRGFATPSVILDSAVRYRGLVLENEASVNDRFSREGTRLVYDDLARTARYTAGDLRPISRGFSGAAPLAGLSIVRTYAELEPQRNVQPRGQRAFTLDRPATVETFVNGRSVQQTRLGPGNYDIRDFPFAQGANNVRLVIRDDTGRESVVSFSINFDRSLLEPGLTEFGLFAGTRSRFGFEGVEYDGDFGASGFFRRGFTESLTAGANFQAGADGAVVGTEATLATALGTLGADVAVSSIEGAGEGYAVNVGYERVFDGVGGGAASIAATVQNTSARFTTPGSFTADNRFSWEVGLSWSQTLGATRFLSTDAFYSVGRGGQADQSSLRSTFGWRSSQRLLWTIEAVYEHRQTEQEYGLRLGLTYRFSPFSSGRAEVDTRRERARIGYQTSRGRGVGAVNASADLETSDGNLGLNAAVSSIRNRAEVGASHQTFFDPQNGTITDQRTSLRLGASLAFADGAVAVSRPIYDSFAMVRPHRSLGRSRVYVDPQDQFYTARSGMLGPAVSPDLSAYSNRLITFDAPQAPAGYDLGAGTAQVFPAYRSGYLITVGSDYFVSASGQLVRADGAPLALWVGEAREASRPDGPPVRLFTNASGRFAVQGLRPGLWRLSASSGEGPVYTLDIPADATLVRAGVLQPEKTP